MCAMSGAEESVDESYFSGRLQNAVQKKGLYIQVDDQLKASIEQMEKKEIQAALIKYDGDLARIADSMGFFRTSLVYKLKNMI